MGQVVLYILKFWIKFVVNHRFSKLLLKMSSQSKLPSTSTPSSTLGLVESPSSSSYDGSKEE
jgi:hypothetical protein